VMTGGQQVKQSQSPSPVEGKSSKSLMLIMVGTGRFELPTPRTSSEGCTFIYRIRHVSECAVECSHDFPYSPYIFPYSPKTRVCWKLSKRPRSVLCQNLGSNWSIV
jgi:hypothetical protein